MLVRRGAMALAALVFVLTLVLAFQPVPVQAQMPTGVRGWQWLGVNYATADEACRAQWTGGGMNNGFSRFIGAVATDSAYTKACKWTSFQYLCPAETGAGLLCGTVLPGSVSFACASGYTRQGAGFCVPTANQVPERPCRECANNNGNILNPEKGNPIALRTGSKVERVLDFATDDGRLAISRSYRLKVGIGAAYFDDHLVSLGGAWSLDFMPELQLGVFSGTPPSPTAGLALLMPDGAGYDFQLLNTGAWSHYSSKGNQFVNTRLKLAYLGTLPSSLSTIRTASTQWSLTDEHDTVWVFKTFPRPNTSIYTTGRPISRTTRDGYVWNYTYNSDGSLASITDSYGRALGFTWRKFHVTSLAAVPSGSAPVPEAVASITLPDGTSLRYTYDPPASGGSGSASTAPVVRLIKAERLDAAGVLLATTTYLYEDARYPRGLTGIVDARGLRIGTYTYGGTAGSALSTEGAGGVNRYVMSYSWSATQMKTTVTNPLGKVEAFTFGQVTTTANTYDFRLTSIAAAAAANSVASQVVLTNATSPYLNAITDAEGRQQAFTYDSARRVTQLVEASGTTAARTTTVAYHPTLNLPVSFTRPGLTETRSYTAGKLDSLTQTDTTSHTLPYVTAGRSRTTSFTWSSTGDLLSADGPLPGTADTVSMTYDAQGQLATRTNELGHVTQVIARNGQGKPLVVRDANGVDTVFTYDGLGRPLTVTRNPGASQSQYAMQYDAAGNMTRLTLPMGGWLAYTYDGASRVTRVDSDTGDYLAFTLNALGAPVLEETHAAGGAIARQSSHAYDELGRLIRTVGAGGQTWSYAYDKVGNLLGTTDARGKVHGRSVDAFDRTKTLTNPEGQVEALAYTAFDAEVSQFTDGRGLATGRVVDGFGQTIEETSPDRGKTQYWYDAAGRLTQFSDARGVTTALSYDAAGRLLGEVATGAGLAAQAVSYGYDSTAGGNRGIGRLTSVADPSGGEGLVYDALGRVVQRSKTIGARAYALSYAYDANGAVTSVTYPSGHVVDYARAGDGRVTGVTRRISGGGAAQVVAGSITHRPFGPLSGLTYGNGLVLTRGHDGNGWLNGIGLTGSSGATLIGLTITRDANGAVTGTADSAAAGRTASYGYSDAGRLTLASGAWGSDSYGWDAASNRIRVDRTQGGVIASDVATIAAGANRITELRDGSGVLAKSFTYSARGDRTGQLAGSTSLTYSYDARARLTGIASGAAQIASYAYDWRGQRVASLSPANPVRHYIYDADGRLLAEHNGQTGAVIREYIWLDSMALATLSGDPLAPDVAYITTGNLNEPLMLTDAAGTVISNVTRDPWGNPVLLAGTTPLELGYPGQWKDPSTGLFQNWHRDYDPALGRYVEADPIGLAGGSNLYGYVGGDPVNRVDPEGLEAIGRALGGWIGAQIGGRVGASAGVEGGPVGIAAGGITGAAIGGRIGREIGDRIGNACKAALAGDDGDSCVAGWMDEVNNFCATTFSGAAYRRCVNRANDRLRACKREGGHWPPSGPDRWSYQDEHGFRP